MIESVLLVQLFVLVLAVFVGFEVITKVPPTLHTPLMSGANAISGVAILGALLVTGQDQVGHDRCLDVVQYLLTYGLKVDLQAVADDRSG